MSEWRPINTAPKDEWFLASGPFEYEAEEHSMRIIRRVEPNGRGGQYGEFVWAEPGAPSVGLWAEMIPELWHPLPAKPERP
jgi:hypothetical protein